MIMVHYTDRVDASWRHLICIISLMGYDKLLDLKYMYLSVTHQDFQTYIQMSTLYKVYMAASGRRSFCDESLSQLGQRLAAFHVSPRRPAATQGDYIYILFIWLNIDLLNYSSSSSNRSIAQSARRRNEVSSASQTTQGSQRRRVYEQSELIKLCICALEVLQSI